MMFINPKVRGLAWRERSYSIGRGRASDNLSFLHSRKRAYAGGSAPTERAIASAIFRPPLPEGSIGLA